MRSSFTVLALAATLVSLSGALTTAAHAAPACPRWDGHYTCQYDGKGGMFPPKTFEMDIVTKDERGATVYYANSKPVYPDGQPHQTDSLPILEEYARDITYVATCAGNGRINITGEATAKKNGMRVKTNGYMQDRDRGRNVDVIFNVQAGFFNLNFNVPCVKR